MQKRYCIEGTQYLLKNIFIKAKDVQRFLFCGGLETEIALPFFNFLQIFFAQFGCHRIGNERQLFGNYPFSHCLGLR